MEEMSLKDKLDKILENQERINEPKPKEFKLPFTSRIGKSSARKNFVTLMIIQENGNINFVKKKINEGTVELEGIPRISTTENVLYYKNNPMIIIPSWSVKPFSPEERYSQDIREKTTTTGMKLLLTKMKMDIISNKTPMNKGIIIILLIAAAVGYYFLNGGKVI